MKLFEAASGRDLGGWDGADISCLRLMPGLLLLGLEDGNVQRLAL